MAHQIENTVKAYLVWGDDGWEIDPHMLDGEPLDEEEGGPYSECECSDEAACNAALAEARAALPPTGRELFKLLADHIRKAAP